MEIPYSISNAGSSQKIFVWFIADFGIFAERDIIANEKGWLIAENWNKNLKNNQIEKTCRIPNLTRHVPSSYKRQLKRNKIAKKLRII